MTRYFFTSVTRIANLQEVPFSVASIPRDHWETGDYVVGEVITPPSPSYRIELNTGRPIEIMEGHFIVGAFGKRFATLEAVGDWRQIGEDLIMESLGGGGVIGKMTSLSPYHPRLVSLAYKGHVCFKGNKLGMSDFIAAVPERKFTLPVILIAGTSMEVGKTTAARIIIRQLKENGLRIVGGKLSGSGRYRDILSMRDAGADYIFDFVDVGLPTTVCPEEKFHPAVRQLLSRMQAVDADVALIEVGASPMEPYNGATAIAEIEENIRFFVLCASDPYSVVGLITAYERRPDLVAGVTTNTEAGIQLVEKLSGVKALNLLDRESLWELRDLLKNALEF